MSLEKKFKQFAKDNKNLLSNPCTTGAVGQYHLMSKNNNTKEADKLFKTLSFGDKAKALACKSAAAVGNTVNSFTSSLAGDVRRGGKSKRSKRRYHSKKRSKKHSKKYSKKKRSKKNSKKRSRKHSKKQYKKHSKKSRH